MIQQKNYHDKFSVVQFHIDLKFKHRDHEQDLFLLLLVRAFDYTVKPTLSLNSRNQNMLNIYTYLSGKCT